MRIGIFHQTGLLALILLAGCATVEQNRAEPNLEKIPHHEQRAALVDDPALAPLLEAERDARHEYYQSIGGDNERFQRAKKALADAVDATEKQLAKDGV